MTSALRLLLAVVVSFIFANAADAARVGVLSNNKAAATAADFAAHMPGHTFVAVDVSAGAPPAQRLLEDFDVVLLFEDSPTAALFVNAPQVGAEVAAFAAAGRGVVLGSFYDQDRSDNLAFVPHGWGALETLDPNVTDGIGTAYSPRSLDPASIVAHPLTTGVGALFAAAGTGFAGGNEAKPGTIVVAAWTQSNAHGTRDPAIAYRVTGSACVIQVGIAPDYASYGAFGAAFGGDFYRAWQNAFDFAAAKCPTPIVPGDPAQIAHGWSSRAELDQWRVGFIFAIVLDDQFVQWGWGPALQLVTMPDGHIVAR